MIKELSEKYNIKIKGIIHVGAHEGQEVNDYLLLTDNVWLWEPIPSLSKKLKAMWPKVRVTQAAAWHEKGQIDFWVTSFSEGSSPLHPLEHEVVDTLDVAAFRLDDVDDGEYNVLVIDTQGSELSVLKGSDLSKYDIVVVETNTRQRYEDAPLKDEILEYMKKTHAKVGEHMHSEDGVISDVQFINYRCVSRAVVIPVGGKGTRWGNYLGVPKYLAPVDEQPILERTIEQVEAHGVKVDVIKDGKTTYGEIDKIYSSFDKWNKYGRTIILFGDTFFTNEALDKIMTHSLPEFTVFGRIGPSQFTGKQYGELYAVSFYPEHIPRILKAIERIVELEKRGAIDIANIWALYRAYHKFPDDMMNRHFAGDGFVEINDFTEDFDWPQDYDNFIERYNK
jgi:FkbM family methyltransferase